MTYDRKDFIEAVRARHDAARSKSEPALHLLAQAAVPAAALMGDPVWAVYQQMLQAAVERTRESRMRMAETLASPQCNTFEQMTRIKQLMAECDGLIMAWLTAINLPKQLIENAGKAQHALDEQLRKYDESLQKAG